MGTGEEDFPELMADITKLKTTGAVPSPPPPHLPALRVQGQIQPVSNKCTPITMTAEEILAHITQNGNVTLTEI
jgi:hypothetical protein